MRYVITILAAAGFSLFTFCLALAQNDDEDAARKIAEEAIKIGAIDYLTDREFKLDGPQLVATARAIDPKEHVKIDLREFNLLPGRDRLESQDQRPVSLRRQSHGRRQNQRRARRGEHRPAYHD